MLYNQWEFYIQDNWKVNNRLTLDYGLRFVNQGPQYDQFQQASNFFPNLWKATDAPVLYVAGCNNGATACSGNARNAMDPRTGALVKLPAGAANSSILIGTPIPGTGNALNGIRKAGDGIAKTNYVWPTIVVGPRFGAAYDVTGKSDFVIRGGFGLFYDRPDGNTVFATPGNAPIATGQDLRNGQLSNLGQGLSPLPVPPLVTYQYNAQVPSQWQWQGGFQKSVGWSMVADVMYVGNHGYNRMGGLQGGNQIGINAVDIGTAFLAKYQDPTLGTNATPGAAAYTTNLLRPYAGYGTINENQTKFWDTYHSIQASLTRRFRNGLSFGANYTYGISLKGNTGLNQRFVHAADGTISLRSDMPAYEKLMETLNRVPHFFKFNSVYLSPGFKSGGKALELLTKDWQISSVVTAASGGTYDLGFSYQGSGGSVNLTGSPDWNGRILYTGDPGSGCSDNQFAQFNTSAVKGPGYGSVGMESGRNIMRGCFNKNVDLSVTRRLRFGKFFNESRRLEFRADIFNALNTVVINGRSTSMTLNNPTNQVIQNGQFNADGSIASGKSLPRNAGFGAANGAQGMRNIQLELRMTF